MLTSPPVRTPRPPRAPRPQRERPIRAEAALLLPLSSLAPRAPALLAALTVAIALACAVPGRPERILPEITGVIAHDGATAEVAGRGRLTLVVIHSRTPSVHDRREVPLAADDRFRFDPLLLDVAGHEFGHHYRIYLHLSQGGADRVIWRAQLSRLEDATPIRLDCDLDREIALGEPCRVVDPLGQPWLLDEGKRHFGRLCADCHGKDARGGRMSQARSGSAGSSAETTAIRAPDLTRLASRHGGRFDRDAVVAWIEGRSLAEGHARGGMPVWGERLSSEFERYAEGEELIGATLDRIVAYLESLQRSDD
ncbi:MAG: c-type cytochrome [Deltaproteobacteria bacterium]|nr:c-type cytochrome [Deltaproteobacteria bacterium]